MPTKNFLLIASLSFTLLVTSRASAQDAPPAAAAPMPSPATGIATDSAATPDRLRGSLRLGPLMSGRIAPYGYTRSTTSVAPFLTTELEFLVLRHFAFGPYAQGGVFSLVRNGTYGGGEQGTGFVVGSGATFKWRHQLTPAVGVSAGAVAGVNLTHVGADGSYSATGTGFNVAPTVQVAYHISPRMGASFQGSFVSTVWGNGTVNGESRSMTYAPMIFVAAGVDFYR